MAVDEVILQSKKDDISNEIAIHADKIRKLEQIKTNLISITMLQDPDDKDKKIKPKDRSLGAEITTARREEIYNKALTDITALGL